jgi:hypothetical protein
MRSKFKGLQLLIFDEISMIGARALWEIHLRCQLACNDDTRRQKPFGGYHILFWGVSQPSTLHVPLIYLTSCRIFTSYLLRWMKVWHEIQQKVQG